MHFRTEMMLGVVAVIEENPIVNLPVATYAPRDWFVRVSAIVTEISIQVAEAMTQVEEGQKKQHVTPIDKSDRVCWNNKRHRDQHANEGSEFDCGPTDIGASALCQFAFYRCGIVAKTREQDIDPRGFC